MSFFMKFLTVVLVSYSCPQPDKRIMDKSMTNEYIFFKINIMLYFRVCSSKFQADDPKPSVRLECADTHRAYAQSAV